MAPSSGRNSSLHLSLRFQLWDSGSDQSDQSLQSKFGSEASGRGPPVDDDDGVCVCAEFPSAGQRNVCVLPEDGLSSGETGGQPAHLSQLLLPLLALQHQTQVSTPPL